LQIDQTSPAFPAGLAADTLFHPLFLYELLWNLIGVGVILLASRHEAIGSGVALGTYLIWYGIGRAWFESFRLDPTELEVFGIKANIITAVIAAAVGITLIVIRNRREKAHPDAPVLGATGALPN